MALDGRDDDLRQLARSEVGLRDVSRVDLAFGQSALTLAWNPSANVVRIGYCGTASSTALPLPFESTMNSSAVSWPIR